MNPSSSGLDIMIPQSMDAPLNYSGYLQNNHNMDSTVDDIFSNHVSSLYTVGEATTILLICIYVPVFLVAFIGNALLLAIVLPHRTVWGVTSSFLVNLALADMLVAVVCIPLTVAEKIYPLWVYGEVLCKGAVFLQGVSVTASTFTLAVMSMDRCLAIRHPMKCRSIRTSGHVRTLLIFIWIFSAIIISPLLFLRKTESYEILPSKYITFCVEKWPSDYTRQIYDVVLLVVLYAIPGTVVIVSYSLMGRRLWTPDKTLEHSRRQNSNYIKNRPTDSIMAGRRNLARMLIVMAALFAACWLPYSIIMTYTGFADDKASLLDVLSFSLLLGHVNSAVNPILYSFMNKTFRKYMKRLLSCHRTKRQSTTNEKGFLLAQMSWKTKSVKSTFVSSFRKTNSATTSPERRSPAHCASQLGSFRRHVSFYGATSNGNVPGGGFKGAPKFSFRSLWNRNKDADKSRSYIGEVYRNFDEGLNIPTTIGEEMSDCLKTSSSSQRDMSDEIYGLDKSQSATVTKCDLHTNSADCNPSPKSSDSDVRGKHCGLDSCEKSSKYDLSAGGSHYSSHGKMFNHDLHGKGFKCDLCKKKSECDVQENASNIHFRQKLSEYDLYKECSKCGLLNKRELCSHRSEYVVHVSLSDGDLHKRRLHGSSVPSEEPVKFITSDSVENTGNSNPSVTVIPSCDLDEDFITCTLLENPEACENCDLCESHVTACDLYGNQAVCENVMAGVGLSDSVKSDLQDRYAGFDSAVACDYTVITNPSTR